MLDIQNQADLLAPLVLEGPAVERDEQVKDHNDYARSDEESWLAVARGQADQISAGEVAFFDELRGRMER